MKAFYVLVAVLVVVAGYFVFANNSSAPTTLDENNPPEQSLPVNDENASADTNEPTQESDGVDVGAELGGDVGMEFPLADDEALLDAKVFDLEGFSFGYDVSEIRVKKGDTVTVNLSVRDGFHDWVVDEFSAATEKIRAGGLTSVTFVADKAGTYEFYCSVGNHRAQGMVGTLIVE